jgi:putative endonuclease
MEKRSIGNTGEVAAKNYLIENGYSIVKENFHFGRHGEIDIIANYMDLLVFVEVRTKKSTGTINPLLTLTNGKKNKIKKTAQGYLYVNKIVDKQCRFDFVCVDFSIDAEKPQIMHIENAF